MGSLRRLLSRAFASLASRLDAEAAVAPERRHMVAVETAARHWRETFDSIPAALVALGPEGEIRRANRVAADCLSVGVASLPGRKWVEFAGEEPWRTADQLAEVVRTLGRGRSHEVRDGAGATWEVHADPAVRGDEDAEGCVILSARDVTDVVGARERARCNESLAALGAVVAGVAHEVRNPLQAISTHVEALVLEGGLLPSQGEGLDAVREEVKRLDRLVNELLEYGRPGPQERQALCLASVLRSAANACALLARSRHVQVQCRCLHLPLIQGDSESLRRVFVNLIENAVQHSPEGSVVEVTSQAAHRAGHEVVECRVADSGPGFPPGDLPRIFEPFFTRRAGGIGLGLPIVRRILADHGGLVEIDNRPEGGACARVELPVLEWA